MLADTDVNPITERIIGCAFAVSRVLRPGFSEKVFANALSIKMRDAGLSFERGIAISVIFEGHNIGDYVADMLVERRVLVELKAVRALDKSHVAQCLNYMAATRIPTCLLLNFGSPRVGVRRLFLKAPGGQQTPRGQVRTARTGTDPDSDGVVRACPGRPWLVRVLMPRGRCRAARRPGSGAARLRKGNTDKFGQPGPARTRIATASSVPVLVVRGLSAS